MGRLKYFHSHVFDSNVSNSSVFSTLGCVGLVFAFALYVKNVDGVERDAYTSSEGQQSCAVEQINADKQNRPKRAGKYRDGE